MACYWRKPIARLPHGALLFNWFLNSELEIKIHFCLLCIVPEPMCVRVYLGIFVCLCVSQCVIVRMCVSMCTGQRETPLFPVSQARFGVDGATHHKAYKV